MTAMASPMRCDSAAPSPHHEQDDDQEPPAAGREQGRSSASQSVAVFERELGVADLVRRCGRSRNDLPKTPGSTQPPA